MNGKVARIDQNLEDTALSATILQRCIQEGSTTLAELADLLNLAPHSVYRYLNGRELRHSQFRAIFRRCADGRVRHAFLNDLLPGLGIVATEVDAPLDVDGDGDIDTDDALHSALDATQTASTSAKLIIDAAADRIIGRQELDQLNELLGEVITQAVMARRVLNFVSEQRGRRRKARPIPGGEPADAGTNGRIPAAQNGKRGGMW